jgi:flagellar basal body-associated protein FliL
MDTDDTKSLWVVLLAALGLSSLALLIAVYLSFALN